MATKRIPSNKSLSNSDVEAEVDFLFRLKHGQRLRHAYFKFMQMHLDSLKLLHTHILESIYSFCCECLGKHAFWNCVFVFVKHVCFFLIRFHTMDVTCVPTTVCQSVCWFFLYILCQQIAIVWNNCDKMCLHIRLWQKLELAKWNGLMLNFRSLIRLNCEYNELW